MIARCASCPPKLVEVGRHKNIQILTLSDIEDIEGQAGDFTVSVRQRPRYVDMDKCIACGACAEKCPKKVTDSYNAGLVTRKAIHVLYPQAVPLKYAIDPEHCIKLTKGKCGICEKTCPAGAINYEDTEKHLRLNVGSVIFSAGFKVFDPSRLQNYMYGKHKNVVTSLEFERILSASGPTSGHLTRPSDGAEPKKIAWLQCVGSRDVNQAKNAHCSSVCCMYAIKEAIIAKEHSHEPLDCAVFFMDMRTHGKDFEACYNDAKKKHEIRFLRSRIHSVEPADDPNELTLRYIDDAGNPAKETFDLVVLSVGLEVDPSLKALAEKLGLALTAGNFCKTDSFSPVQTSREGIYVCGAFQGPKDIPQSVIEASSAALCAGKNLAAARGTLTKQAEVVPETNVHNQRPRIGVFVCHCGSNIGGVVDVPGVTEYAKSLPYVVFASDNLYSCSQDTQDAISAVIKEHKLNRIVVAACTPKTHEPLFQETLAAAGLNKYLFEFANIRNHVSWVHKENPQWATEKSKELVRMAVAKVACFSPLREAELEISQSALVIGGGLAGMSAAKGLSEQGYAVHLVEREPELGGQARHLRTTWLGEDVQAELTKMVESVKKDENIHVHTDTTLSAVDGFVGNFISTLKTGGEEQRLPHGVTVIATGAKPYEPTEYLYGQHQAVVTHRELDRRFRDDPASLDKVETAVFIQCVGSREPERPYCSRVCCTHSVESAIHLKEMNPERNVVVLYRDIRTYGERENLFEKARRLGVVFVRFGLDKKPEVRAEGDKLVIRVEDHILHRPMDIHADLLTLATAIVPYKDEQLAQFFKVPLTADGFFLESHVKLAPSDFATDGVFLCGMAHYPKPIDEAIAHGLAAASRATTLLARKHIAISGQVAYVNQADCSGCGVCVEVCPYNAPGMIVEGRLKGKSEINPMTCKGCGLCMASCRSGAINLRGYEQDQIMAQLEEAI